MAVPFGGQDPTGSMTALFGELQEAVIAAHARAPASYVYPEKNGNLEFALSETPTTLGHVYRCRNRPGFPDMPVDFGCTAVVAVVLGESVVLGNAGDAAAILCAVQADDPEVVSARLLTQVVTAEASSGTREMKKKLRTNEEREGKTCFQTCILNQSDHECVRLRCMRPRSRRSVTA